MRTFANQLIEGKYLTEGNSTRLGISELWDAQDQQLERPVTIQMLAEKESADPGVCDTFLAHQRIASSIQDSALFAVYDAGIWDGRAFSVMQRFFGVPAGELHAPNRPPDVLLALAAARQVAEGLERCRQAGLTDWVFSPDAVLIDPEGNARLAIVEGLTAPGTAGDAEALGELLRVMLTGDRAATGTQLRAAFVPTAVIDLLERFRTGQGSGIRSAGEAAEAIAAIETAAMQPTEAYDAGTLAPDVPGDPAMNDIALGTSNLSEAPTLVAPVLPAAGWGAEATVAGASSGVGASPPPPVRATRSFGAYSPPMNSERDTITVRKNRRAVWIVPLCVIALLLALGFLWLKLLSPATSVQGQVVHPTVTPTAAPPAPVMVAVPDLRGKSLDEAVSMVQASRLSLTQGSSDYNADYSAGQIAAQQPTPGEQVQAGGIITVSVSLGPAPTAAPAPPVVARPPAQPPAPRQNGDQGNNKGKGKGKHK